MLGVPQFSCGNWAMNKTTLIALMAGMALAAWGQETAPIRLKLDTRGLTERFMQPITPQLPTPSAGLLSKPDLTEPIRLDWRTAQLTDSLRAYDRMSLDQGYSFPSHSVRDFNFVMDPYSRNWSSAGVIATVGTGYLAGAGSYTAMPGLGNVGSANVSFTQPLGEQLVVTAGLSGNKYHFGNAAWNSYGVYGNASFKLNDRLTLNAFGQYYRNPMLGSVAAMPYMQDTRYGGTLGIKMSDKVSLDVGAQRYYDPYLRQWKTVPIIAPTVSVMGQPLSLDVGGLLYQVLDYVFGSSKNGNGYGSHLPDFRQGPVPAGFNPNSPIRIPDALR